MLKHRSFFFNITHSTLIAYGVAAILLICLADPKKIYIHRLDCLQDWGSYPMDVESGKASFHPKDMRFAIRYYYLMTRFLPAEHGAYGMIGYGLSALGDDWGALRYYLEARAHGPKSFWYDYDLGVIYYRLGNLEKAKACFQLITNIGSNDLLSFAVPYSLYKVSAVQRQMLLDMAGQFAEQIRERSWWMLVRIELEKGRYAEARSVVSAAQADPSIKGKTGFIILDRTIGLALDQPSTQSEDFLTQVVHDKNLFPELLTKLVVHPWVHVIPPRKEVLFQ